MSNLGNEVPQTGAPHAQPERALDYGITANAALYGCPAWAGDSITLLPAETDTSSASLESGASVYDERVSAETECPLHTAMRHLTEAAVAQHVLYLEGEVLSRANLVSAITRWERMHTLIRECICPATREVSLDIAVLTAATVDSTLEGMFTPEQETLRWHFIRTLEACAACQSVSECPLGASL